MSEFNKKSVNNRRFFAIFLISNISAAVLLNLQVNSKQEKIQQQIKQKRITLNLIWS